MRSSSLPLSVPLPRWFTQSNGYRPVSDDEQSLNLGDGNLEKHETEPNTPSLLREATRSFVRAITPAILASGPARRLYPTSWLDGLRGVAAFFVVFHHASLSFYRSVRPGYGSTPLATNILALPVLRLLFSGGAMVAIFFVISGYVLSTKALKLSRLGAFAEVYDAVGSSTFRRGPRLYIPTLTVIFIIAILAQLGVADNLSPVPYPTASSMWEQIRIFISASSWFITPWAPMHHFERNSWTIPIEFKGSLLVFLTCMGLAQSGSRFRFLFLFSMTLFFLWHGLWEFYLFSGGMFAADLHFVHTPIPLRVPPPLPTVPIAGSDQTEISDQISHPPPPSPPRPRPRRPVRAVVHALLIFGALYLLSAPENDELFSATPGFMTLSKLQPAWYLDHFGPGRWWPTLAALFLVIFIDHAGPDSIYQRCLTSRFAQYLGDISFSLYLCHGPVLHTVVSRVIRAMCEVLGVSWQLGCAGLAGPIYWVALLVAMLVGWPVLLWVSEISTNLVDRGAVEFARRMMRW